MATHNAYSKQIVLLVLVSLCVNLRADSPNLRLFEWQKGIGVQSRSEPGMSVFLWFYEWNMFDAREQGIHTPGSFEFERSVNKAGTEAEILAPDMRLVMKTVADGVELALEITNRSNHDWPDIAGIIPCFNPGAPNDQAERWPTAKLNAQFDHRNTWFVSREGLTKLNEREIHFDAALRSKINAAAIDDKFPFTHKWPTSPKNAHKGLMIRESANGKWVAGIAWEQFLSAQGHNPWQCMHLCVNVGPLKQGETKSIRGRIYLFEGDKDDCYRLYTAEFLSK